MDECPNDDIDGIDGIVVLRGFIHERNIFIFFIFFFEFSFGRAVSAALVLKVVVVQRFGGAV
jgi:hypothetical protein